MTLARKFAALQEFQSVFVRDAQHEGTLVTRLEDGWRIDQFDNARARTFARVVLIELAEEETDSETATVLWSWEHERLPHEVYGCDMEDGVLVLGLDEDEELPERLGEVLWDSWEEGGQ